MSEKYYIVRGQNSGVWAGNIKARNGQEVTMTNARRLWYWDGAASISELAQKGTKKPSNCKFPVAIDEVLILDAIEIDTCTIKLTKIKGYDVYYVDNGYYAHGDTITQAREDAQEKYYLQGDVLEHVARVKEKGTINALDYRALTGACRQGTDFWLNNNGFNWQDEQPIAEVLKLTKGQYGNDKLSELLK